MLSAKTTALIVAMSVLGTVAPAAFAQDDFSVNIARIEGVTQSNTNTFDIEQNQVGAASASTVQEILDALGL
jgi:hypothetical protein